MATLKEHQAAMVDLLANGSGIPASASRLAHAMHDLINVLYVAFPNLPQTKGEDWINGRETRLTITPDITLDIKDIIRAVEANSPGLNDKALSKPQKALATDSPAKWPTPAEQRVKELTNTAGQLRKQSAQYRATIANQKEHIEHLQFELEKLRKQIADNEPAVDLWERWSASPPEQAGCRKPDTQVCEHEFKDDGRIFACKNCGAHPSDLPDTQVCEHDYQVGNGGFYWCTKCQGICQ